MNKEQEVINLYVQGKSIRTISSILHISRKTILILENKILHLRNISVTKIILKILIMKIKHIG